MYSIDINCDLGEGIGNEEALMPFITSCNIACGGHAGDRDTMIRVIALAAINGVLIGAHPSYPDREHFGRKTLDIPEKDLVKSIRTQIGGLEKILKRSHLNHIKPHGALYNDIAVNRQLARVFLRAIQEYRDSAYLFVPYGSIIAEEALGNGFRIKYEAFLDRNYNSDLSLVSRSRDNALIEDPKAVLDHLLPIVVRGEVISSTGQVVKLRADTFCIHGDAPATLQILTYLAKALPKHKISFKK
jgi:UPF0271 protein